VDIKVLLIDYKNDGLRGFTEELAALLDVYGFQVKKVYWAETESDSFLASEFELNVDRAIETAKTVNVVFIHFGSMPRGEASKILGRIKETGVKVIVSSVSPVLFEVADYVFPVSGPVLELIDIIKYLAETKD